MTLTNELLARRAEVERLRLMGRSRNEIARLLGVPYSTICDDLAAIQQAWRDQYEAERPALREAALAANDFLMQLTLTAYVSRPSALYMANAIKLLELRCKLVGLLDSKVLPTAVPSLPWDEIAKALEQQPADSVEEELTKRVALMEDKRDVG